MVCRILHFADRTIDLTRVGGARRAGRGGHPSGAHRAHRQVREPARRLPVGGRGLQARRVPPRRQGRDRLDPGRGGRGHAGRRPPGRPRRHRHPRRLRRAGHGGQDRGRRLRPGARHPVPRPLPRPAGHDHRVRPQRARHDRRQLHRDRRPHPVPGHRPDGQPAGRHRPGRHHAPRRLRGRARRRARRWPGPTGATSCPSATATATSSTPASGPGSRRARSGCRARRPTTGWSSSSSSTGHPFWVGTQAHPELKSRPEPAGPAVPGVRRRRPRAGRGPGARTSSRCTAPAVVACRRSGTSPTGS